MSAQNISGASQNSFTLDADTILKDAGAVTTTGVGQVSAANRQLDFGNVSPNAVEQVAYVRGQVVIDVAALDFGTGDEAYDIVLQLSDDVAFASGNVATKPLVHLGTALGPDGDTQSGLGRIVVGVDNEFLGTLFRHARIAHVIAGTTPSIDYQAALVRSY